MPFDPLSPASYTPHVHDEFRLARPAGGYWTLKLESVDVSIDTPAQLCFSILFRCPDTDLPSGLARLTHAQRGEIVLNLGLVRLRRGGFGYEAVFNLLRDGAEPPPSGPSIGISNPQP